MLNDELFMKRFRADIENERFIALKQQNAIKEDIGYMKGIKNFLTAFKSGKNQIFLGGVGLGKTICALEIAWRLKCEDMDLRVHFSRYGVTQSGYKANFGNLEKTLNGIFHKESYYWQDPPQPTKLVILDEVHNSSDFGLLNEIIFSAYDNIVPMIIIGNCSGDDFSKMISTMAMSRLLENGDIISNQGADLRQNNRVRDLFSELGG